MPDHDASIVANAYSSGISVTGLRDNEAVSDRLHRTETGDDMTLISTLIRMIRVWHRYNESVRALEALGDRELADIGILRAEIPRIAWDAVHPH